MAAIFKIFLFFLLKQGSGVLKKDSGDYITFRDSSSYQYSIMEPLNTLHLQGDPQALEIAVDICQAFMPVSVEREMNQAVPEGSVVRIRFEKIADEARTRICHQLILKLAGKVMVEWKAEGTM